MIGSTAYTAEITQTYGYAGKQGRVSVRDTAAKVTAPFIGTPASFTQSWTWNDLGDVASVTYPVCTHAGCTATAIRTVTPGYTNGFLSSVPGYTSPSAPNGRPITYHPNGQVNEIFRANDTKDIYTKDPQNQPRPRKIEARVTSSGTLRWSSALLSYDGAGNLTTAGNAYYLYDAASRVNDGLLYLAPGGGGATATFDHAYDGFGNLQSLTTNAATRNTPTSPTTNRLLGTAGYDAAGNLTSWGVTTPGTGATYRYDALNQMWGMKNGAEDWLYLYTADGERLWSYHPIRNVSRWTIRDLDGKVLREYKNDGTAGWSIERDYVYRGSQLFAAHTLDPAPNDLIHFHPDHLATPRAITNQNAVQTDYHIYFPFGEEASSPTQDLERMKFTGHERDLGDPSSPTDDLDYMHARFHNPQTGRFLSVDPKNRYRPMKAPQQWNRYAYAVGNPLKFVDPDGEETRLVVGGHTENNVFGHVAIAIDDIVYSFGTSYVDESDDWGVSLDAYLSAQEDKRSTTLLTLDVSPEGEDQLTTILKANDPRHQPYSVLSNSCVTVCETALESAGILPNNPGAEHTDSAGNQLQSAAPTSSTPSGLAGQVQGAGLVTSSSTQGQQKVSKLRALWNTVRGAIERIRE